MDFNLSEEETMLHDAAGRYLREHYVFEDRRKLAASPDGFSRARWQEYAQMGWLGLNLPEDVGGFECSFVNTALLMEQFGRAMVLEPIVSTAVLCAHLLDAGENSALRAALLPSLVQGQLLLALADDELRPRGAHLPETVAVSEGTGFRLQGFKLMVPDGASADRLVLSVRLEQPGVPAELALFVLDPNAPGMTLEPYSLVSGQRAVDVHLEGVSAGPSELLARGAKAQHVLDEALDRARLACMAQSLGAIEACLDISSDYIKGRSQFGQPLGKFQALQHLIAEMFVDAQEARSILYQALASIAASPARRGRAISAAKLVIGDSGRRVSSNSIQLHGGYGTTDEYAVSHYYRFLFVLEKMFGDTSFHAKRFSELRPSNCCA